MIVPAKSFLSDGYFSMKKGSLGPKFCDFIIYYVLSFFETPCASDIQDIEKLATKLIDIISYSIFLRLNDLFYVFYKNQ